MFTLLYLLIQLDSTVPILLRYKFLEDICGLFQDHATSVRYSHFLRCLCCAHCNHDNPESYKWASVLPLVTNAISNPRDVSERVTYS